MRTIIVLPLLSNRGYGPYPALKPHHLWLIVGLISGVILAGYLALRFTGAKRSLPLFGAVWLSQLWGSSGLCAMAAVSGGAYAANSVVKFAFVLARAPPPWYGIARSPFVPPRPGCSWVLRGCKLLLFQ